MTFEPPKDYIDVATRITEFRDKHPEGTLAPWDPAKPYELITAAGVAKDGREFTATFVVVVAAARRTPDDRAPGVGMAWEVFPGRTPYTLGSELMNAETSAWGRAIIAVGAVDSKKGIASAEEVRNRQAERDAALPGSQPVTFTFPGGSQVTVPPMAEDPRVLAGAAKASPRGPGGPGDWRPPANPNSRKADRHNGRRGPLPDDEWTVRPADDETVSGTSTPEQWQQIAIRLEEKGISTREGKLAFCSRSANRPVGSSKELSYLEAAEVIRRAGSLPAAAGPLAEAK